MDRFMPGEVVFFNNWDDTLDSTVWFEYANLTSSKACTTRGIINSLLLIQEHRFDSNRFKYFPAVLEWSDFNDLHGNIAFSSKSYICSLEHGRPNNGHELATMDDARPRSTGEHLLRERPKIYRQVVRLLGEGWSSNKICKWCHVTRETVRAISR